MVVGISNDLTREEYIPLLRASLDFNVIKCVEQVFVQNPNSIKTWENISVEDLHKLLID